mmetsp:Transcript_254/g.729  ORF Transcript_254/g.729 Transcript_254/m.729 type:complete len:117 (-) Transcript_254:755-1105(-)
MDWEPRSSALCIFVARRAAPSTIKMTFSEKRGGDIHVLREQIERHLSVAKAVMKDEIMLPVWVARLRVYVGYLHIFAAPGDEERVGEEAIRNLAGGTSHRRGERDHDRIFDRDVAS